MKKLKLKVTGLSPLLMHDNKGANPLSIYAQTMKKLNSKRNRTIEDYEELARMDWESGLYLYDGVVVIPARCIEKCLHNGAKKSKKGPVFQSGVVVEEDFCVLNYNGTKIRVNMKNEFPNDELDKFYEEHRNIQMVKIGQNQIPRCRPIFYDWSFEVTLVYEPSIIDRDTLIEACDKAGKLVGLLEQRPRLGRFEVEVLK